LILAGRFGAGRAAISDFTEAGQMLRLVNQFVSIISVFEERPQQPPQFAVRGSLTALLEIIRDIHCGGLHLNCAANARVQKRHLALDIQALGVRIEDQRATIRVGDLRSIYLTI